MRFTLNDVQRSSYEWWSVTHISWHLLYESRAEGNPFVRPCGFGCVHSQVNELICHFITYPVPRLNDWKEGWRESGGGVDAHISKLPYEMIILLWRGTRSCHCSSPRMCLPRNREELEENINCQSELWFISSRDYLSLPQPNVGFRLVVVQVLYRGSLSLSLPFHLKTVFDITPLEFHLWREFINVLQKATCRP